jgi:hypothetical protein
MAELRRRGDTVQPHPVQRFIDPIVLKRLREARDQLVAARLRLARLIG